MNISFGDDSYVCDREDCAVVEGLPNHLLQKCVRLHINIRGALVHHQQLTAPQQCSGKAQQLPLSNGEAPAALADLAVK